MTALFTRKQQTTTRAVGQPPTTTDWPEDVVARFRTRGGATVELHRQDRTVRHFLGRPGELMPNGETRISHGFNWRCLGCDAIGGGGRYGLGNHHYDEREPHESRNEANKHAADCHSMPRPQNR